MPSGYQDTKIEDLDWDHYSLEEISDLAANDDRSTVQARAHDVLNARNTVQLRSANEYDPRQDLGPERREDIAARETLAGMDFAEVEGQIEVSLEESRKDETTVLATDTFDGEGNRIT